MAHWIYLLAAAGPTGLAVWRYGPRAFLMVIAGLAKDPQRSKQCLEVIRLLRKDAKELPSYLIDPPVVNKPVVSVPSSVRKRRRSSSDQSLDGSSDRNAS